MNCDAMSGVGYLPWVAVPYSVTNSKTVASVSVELLVPFISSVLLRLELVPAEPNTITKSLDHILSFI